MTGLLLLRRSKTASGQKGCIGSRHPADNMLQDVYIYQEASFMASGVSFIYASSEKNRMLACRFGEHRDNSRNLQSVFLVVALYNGKRFD